MTKLYVPISNEEFNRLALLARDECRSPRDQARHILRQALLGQLEQATQTPAPVLEAQPAGPNIGR